MYLYDMLDMLHNSAVLNDQAITRTHKSIKILYRL